MSFKRMILLTKQNKERRNVIKKTKSMDMLVLTSDNLRNLYLFNLNL